MVNLLLLLFGLATSSINATSLPKKSLGPSNPMNLTDLHYSSITNTTSLSDPRGIDPRFGVHYTFGGIPLRPLACIMNAINAMKNLALEDFNGDTQRLIARLPAYPDVVIRSDTTNPESFATTPIRYIIWGIWSVALFMMKRNVFQSMFVTLGFNGVTVGYLRIEKPDTQILSVTGNNDESSAEKPKRRSDVALPVSRPLITLQNSTMPSNGTSLAVTDTATTPSNAGDLRFFFSPFGRRLTGQEFFLPILAGLDYVARFSSTSPVDGFKLHPADTNTEVEFSDFATQPETHAALFEYQCVAKALWELSMHMALLGYWSEVKVVIQVDDASVGVGWIRLG